MYSQKNIILGFILYLATVIQFQPVHAATLEDLAKALATDPYATFAVETTSVQNPVSLTVTSNGKELGPIIVDPATFVASVRSLTGSKEIKSGSYTYVSTWQRLELKGQPAPFFDLENDLHDHQYDPRDFEGQNIPFPGSISGGADFYKVISVVGPYVSYSASGSDFYPGAAHPNDWNKQFTTFDAQSFNAKTGTYNVANLLDLVDETSLVEALKADKFLNMKLFDAKAKKALKSAHTFAQVSDALFDMKDCYGFPGYENKLDSFAVYDWNQKTKLVSIRISVGARAHVCAIEAPTVQVGVAVKPLADFENLLSKQVRNNDGLFMKQLRNR